MLNKKLINDFLSIKEIKVNNYDELYNKLDSYEKGKYKMISYSKINKNISQLFSGKYIGVKIENISNTINIRYLVNDKIYVNLYFCKIDKINKLLIEYLINIITYIISLKKYNKDISDEINIYYYLSEEKKKIFNEGYLLPENVNSGYTYSNNIFIYRLEDIYKVTIHELIHLLGYHKCEDIDQNKLIIKYSTRYNIKGLKKIKLYETYTEILANIFHIYFISKFTNKDNNKLFNLLLSIEIEYSIILAQKILSLNLEKDINKYTNILEYFIIRGEYYLNFNQNDLLFILNSGITCNDGMCFLLKDLNKIEMDRNIINELKNYKELYESLSMILIRPQLS